MTRKPNGPRVTPKKNRKQPVRPDAPKVELKTRTSEQKIQDYQDVVDTADNTDAAQQEDVLGFEYNGQEFRFKPIDEDVGGMLISTTLLGNKSVLLANEQEMLQLIMEDGEWDRLRVAMKSDLDKVYKNRRKWKEDGRNPADEPINVADFMAEAMRGIINIYTKAIEASPKGAG